MAALFPHLRSWSANSATVVRWRERRYELFLRACSVRPTDRIIDVIIDALDLRAHDPKGALRETTSRRYLRGERVGAEAEARVISSVADALLAADIIPRSLVTADILPEPPPGAPEIPMAAAMAPARRWT